jgi:hypothetical protein
MGEDAEDEEEDEDANDGGDAAAPPVLVPPAARPKEVIAEEDPVEMVPMQEAPVAHEVILADVSLICRSPISTTCFWMMTRMKATLTWISGFRRMEAMIGIELSSLSLNVRFKNNSLGFT